MAYNDKTDRTIYLALGMMFGAAAGVGAGMLMAPRKGEETRSKLKMHVQEAKRKSLDKSKELVNRASDKTKEVVDESADRAKEAASRAQTRARDSNLGA